MKLKTSLIALALSAAFAAPSLMAQVKGDAGPMFLSGGAAATPDGTTPPQTSFTIQLGTRLNVGACNFSAVPNPAVPGQGAASFNLGVGGVIKQLGAVGSLRSIAAGTFASEGAMMFAGAVRPGEVIRLRPLAATAATFTVLPFDIALIDLTDNALPNITLGAAGVFTLGFCESFVDGTPPAPDSQFENLGVRIAGDNIAAPNPVTQSNAVPVNSTWGLIGMLALLTGVGLVSLRRSA